MAARSPLPWDDRQDELLTGLRHLGDPVTDDRVRSLDVPDARALFERLVDDIRGDPEPGRDWVATYFTRRPTWPDWVDRALVEEGQRFYRSQLWSLNVAFMLGSLPMSYLGHHGAEVLCRTGRMTRDAQRRLFETALLVMELAEPGGLGDGTDGGPVGDGYLTVLRLRLLHAAARTSLLHLGTDQRPVTAGPWDPDEWGAPVSQLDLLGTMWCFSLTSMHALTVARRPPTPAEEAAWVHLWCLVGHLLGLDASPAGQELPMAPDEAKRCFDAVQRLQFQGSPAGQALTTSLLDVGHRRIPFKRWDHLVEALVRRNLGDEYADELGVDPHDDPELVARAEWFWCLTTGEDAPRGGTRTERLGRARVKRYLLRRLARHLMDEDHDLRSPSAVARLVESYELSGWDRRRARMTARAERAIGRRRGPPR